MTGKKNKIMFDLKNLDFCDFIEVERLRARCIVGLFPEERLLPRNVWFSLQLWVDLSEAGRSDDIAHTVDYDSLSKSIISMAENSSYELIEALAEHAAQLCLSQPLVQACRITLEKPGAVPVADNIKVSIFRKK